MGRHQIHPSDHHLIEATVTLYSKSRNGLSLESNLADMSMNVLIPLRGGARCMLPSSMVKDIRGHER